MSVIDLEAKRRWNKLPKEIQKRLIHNVFCSKCFDTTIVDYTMKSKDNGVLLEGKCKTCHKNVARMVEDIE